MTAPPTGTVTFLFTDVEGSTRQASADAAAWSAALARHQEISAQPSPMRRGSYFG